MKKIDVKALLEIGIALTSEKDRNKLYSLIIDGAMDFTGCDGGTLYICEGETLVFKIMITRSQGVHRGEEGEQIDIPPVPMKMENVCAYSALMKQTVNVTDVQTATAFDFSGPKRYDRITGYHTQSMLVVPMEDDRGRVIGVLQLINALDADGNIVAFDENAERVVKCLASQTAISLENVSYAKELEGLLNSFVRVMSTAIDEKTPYNANHTRKMAQYGERFLQYLDKTNHPWRFDEGRKKEFIMSVWLHDIGKLVIPLSVMNKESRLGGGIQQVRHRFREMELLNCLRLARGETDAEGFTKEQERQRETLAFLEDINTAGFLTDEALGRVEEIGARFYQDEKGEKHPWLTKDELCNLSIRRGTLTAEERGTMESHVVMTRRFLEEIEFRGEYEDVPRWASEHHEFLNGTGYPDGIAGNALEPEVRLLTILDIFDSLTAADRPYKPPMPVARALDVLGQMADEGKLDKDVLALFRESRAWEQEK